MHKAVIVGGVRTPFVRAGSALRFTPAQELGRLATREVLFRHDVAPEEVDELVCGNVGTPPDATNVARVIALQAGIPHDRIAHTVSRNCASGMDSVTQAITQIERGDARMVVAVGVESMSNSPILWTKQFAENLLQMAKAKSGLARLKAMARMRPSHLKPIFGIEQGLRDPVSGLIMGETAEKLAREFGLSRRQQDEFAAASHQKAMKAQETNRLGDEVMTIYPAPKLEPIAKDIGPRANQTADALGKMKPYFDRKYGTVTVGNACQITDGAVALLLMEEEAARAKGFRPLGRVRAFSYAGCDPARMGLGPVYATAKALQRAGMKLSDLELFELNEAFAAQVMACVAAMNSKRYCEEHLGLGEAMGEIPEDRLNVNGGAIALGHPVGATGARITLTLLKELERRGQANGLATLCVGGGQGGAVIVERN